MKIAIVGAGISGLTAAYLLSKKYDVTVLEKSERLGGHTATIDVCYGEEQHAIDTGFIVYNERTYPNFIKLLAQLKVRTQASSMGFSVSCPNSGLEYAGNSVDALFAQRKNSVSPQFWRMLRDIVRFNRQATNDLDTGKVSNDITLGEYLKKNHYSQAFCRYYLIPMGAAIWSASFTVMQGFPLLFFVRFFLNHGLLSIFDKPQWRVISGGSREYIAPLTERFKQNIHCNVLIKSIKRREQDVVIQMADGQEELFDYVIMATHSDEALSLLADASQQEKDILGAICYKENTVVLHCDDSLLPKTRKTWSSWNYRLSDDEARLPILTYNMNMLQSIQSEHVFCVTLNADDDIKEEKIIGRYRYAHPQFDISAINAQLRHDDINGRNRTFFCGAYWGNGFHEDGVVSALRVARHFDVSLS